MCGAVSLQGRGSYCTHDHDSGGKEAGLITHPLELFQRAHQEHGAEEEFIPCNAQLGLDKNGLNPQQ